MLGLGDGEALQVVSKMAFHCTLIGFNVSRQDARTQRTIANDSLRLSGVAALRYFLCDICCNCFRLAWDDV